MDNDNACNCVISSDQTAAGRQKAKMSNDQASLGQAFQLRQMANEILTNALKSCRNIDQASKLIDFVEGVALGIDIKCLFDKFSLLLQACVIYLPSTGR